MQPHCEWHTGASESTRSGLDSAVTAARFVRGGSGWGTHRARNAGDWIAAVAHARVRVADDGRRIAQLGTRYIYAGCLSDVDVDAGCLSDRLEGDGQGHSSQQHGVRQM